jgi:Protein of unknown function (DUF1329)
VLTKFIALVLIQAAIVAGTATAQVGGASSSENKPNIPEASDGLNRGVIIDSQNGYNFRELIPHELYPMIKNGSLVIDAVKGLRFDLTQFVKNQQIESSTNINLQANGQLPENFRVSRDIQFKNLENDTPEVKAKKVLWNVQSRLWNMPLFEEEVHLLWISESGPRQKAVANFSRIYPQILDEQFKPAQLFREKLSFYLPPALKKFSFLTFRFLGEDEDMLWLFSPALNKTRQLTGFNRSDGILSSSVSLDDLHVWSGKVEYVDAVISKNQLLLSPFADLNIKTLKEINTQCEGVEDASVFSNTENKWNYQNQRFSQAAAWVPTASVFVPRNTVRLEIFPREVFSRYGKQILYIDNELHLPYYKIVYDRSGKLWKTILTGYQALENTKHDKRFILPSYLIIYDHKNKALNIVEFYKQRICSSYAVLDKHTVQDNNSVQNRLSMYDPQSLEK